jgi:hypothetical protein
MGGNGNNMHFVEVRVGVCTGEESRVKFDRPAFRDSRSEANMALGQLSMIALGGKDMSWYQNDTGVRPYLGNFPVLSHIISIAVVKVNRESDGEKVFSERHYECDCSPEKEPA